MREYKKKSEKKIISYLTADDGKMFEEYIVKL